MDKKRFALALVILILAGCAPVSAEFSQTTPALDVSAVEEGQDQQVAQSAASLPSHPEGIGERATDSDGSHYWIKIQDGRTGLRFAVPCFWEVTIPPADQDPSGLAAFSIRNYDKEFALAHPKGEGFWESGALKIDIGYVRPTRWGLNPGASPSDVAHAMVERAYSELEVAGTGYVTVNGQSGLEVATRGKTGSAANGRFYLFALTPDLYVTYSAAPASALAHSDVQGVLHSLALNAEADIQVPDVVSSSPLSGVGAPCLEGVASLR